MLHFAIGCLFIIVYGSEIDPQEQFYIGDIKFSDEWRGFFGSCGIEESTSDPHYVAALSLHWMKLPKGQTNPNNHRLCSEENCLMLKGKRGSAVVKVSDTCYGCEPHDVTIADEVFKMLDDPRAGHAKMTWKFIDCNNTLIKNEKE